MVSLLVLLLALPIFLFFLFQNNKTKTDVPLPPGPRGLPLIGNLHQLDSAAPHRYLWQISKKYGPLMLLRLGCVPTVVVSSAKVAKEMMRSHDIIFANRPTLLGHRKLSYNCLDLAFAPYDAFWREMRKICVVHLFNSIRAQTYRPIREDEVSRMLKKISKSADASKPFNLSDSTMSMASTLICRVAFGKRFEEDGAESNRFQALLSESQALFASFYVSDHLPLLGFVDRLSGLVSRLEKNFKEFDEFYKELIDEHLDPNRQKAEQEDLLDVLLQIYKGHEFKFELSFENIKGVLMDVFVPGTDTSAATIVWAMTFLMKNPIAMKKAQEEVRSVVGKKGFVNEADVEKLPYLNAVIRETMRLQPSVPLIPRKASEKCILGGYEIPAKSVVYISTYAIGRDPEVWENPEEFNPERFVGNPIDLKGQDFELIPFGAGRRICPGMYIGLSNVELSLANLIYKFDWGMPAGIKKEDLDMDVAPGITMHKKNALSLMPRKYI